MTTSIAHQDLPIALGEPTTFGGLTVVPLFPERKPRFEYVGLDEAVARGLVVTEVDESGDVNTLKVHNPLGDCALLYDGEELVGAKQNRIVRFTTLIAQLSTVALEVDCVERGRWSYRTRKFAPVDRVAYPELRRKRHEGGGQGEVWASVAAKSVRLDAHSPTEAQEAMYKSRSTSLDEYAVALPRLTGQCGALVGVAGEIVCLDYVSRPDVFAGLYAKLLRGYALDAIETPVNRKLRISAVKRFIESVVRSEVRLTNPRGIGYEGRFTGGVFGQELSAYGELIALTAYPGS